MSSVDQSNQLNPNNPLYYAPRHFRDRANDPAAMRRLIDIRKGDSARHALTVSGFDGGTEWQEPPTESAETVFSMRSRRGPMSKLLVAAVLVAASAGFSFWIVPDILGIQAELSSANRGGASLAVIQSAAADVSSALKSEPARVVENSTGESNVPLPRRVKITAIAPEAILPPVGMAKTQAVDREAVAKAEPAASSAPRKMLPEEIAALIRRGEELATDGDFPAARLLLQRAAEAHEPRAALALAATYDPVVIKRFTVTGAAPDKTLAEAWYQKAREWDPSIDPKQGNAVASIVGR
jgi:hypothetical protein